MGEGDSDDGQTGYPDDVSHEDGDLGEREIPHADESKQRLKLP